MKKLFKTFLISFTFALMFLSSTHSQIDIHCNFNTITTV